MKLVVAGEGAFGNKHLDALARIDGVEVVSLIGGDALATKTVALERNIAHWSLDLQDGLNLQNVDGVILATPTPIHARQALQCLDAGKHVLVEIPMADNILDARALVAKQKQTGLVAMAGHVRRFNPSHQWLHKRIKSGALSLQHLDVETIFFRRSNTNAKGEARTWTDHLLWHHACHTIDLFLYQTGEEITNVQALQGPIHPELGIAMDMSIGMKTTSGKLCTLALSFNNEGPLGTYFRYICDNGTYLARYDDLYDGWDKRIDVSNVDVSVDGIELIDREFIRAIRDGGEPNASVAKCLPAMEVLHRIEQILVR